MVLPVLLLLLLGGRGRLRVQGMLGRHALTGNYTPFAFFSSKLYLNISQPEEPQPSPPLSFSSHPDKPNFFDSLVLLIVNFALL